MTRYLLPEGLLATWFWLRGCAAAPLQVLSVRTDLRYWPLVVLQRDPATGTWTRRVLSKL